MKFIFLYLAMFFLTVSCTKNSDVSKKTYSLKKEILNNQAIGLDVRNLQEIEMHGSKGAKKIPLNQLSQRAQELNKEKKILVFCEAGGRASQAQKILEEKGFKNVVNIKDWREWNELSEVQP